MNDKQDVSRNDLALRIATDVLGDPSRAGGLAEYFAKENTDVYRALERFAESRCATARSEERERCAKAAEAVTLPDRWIDGSGLSHSERCAANDAAGLIVDAIRALTPTPEANHE